MCVCVYIWMAWRGFVTPKKTKKPNNFPRNVLTWFRPIDTQTAVGQSMLWLLRRWPTCRLNVQSQKSMSRAGGWEAHAQTHTHTHTHVLVEIFSWLAMSCWGQSAGPGRLLPQNWSVIDVFITLLFFFVGWSSFGRNWIQISSRKRWQQSPRHQTPEHGHHPIFDLNARLEWYHEWELISVQFHVTLKSGLWRFKCFSFVWFKQRRPIWMLLFWVSFGWWCDVLHFERWMFRQCRQNLFFHVVTMAWKFDHDIGIKCLGSLIIILDYSLEILKNGLNDSILQVEYQWIDLVGPLNYWKESEPLVTTLLCPVN